MGRTIVAIKPSKSTGASGVTRYIAESKRDPEKEHLREDEGRPLFSTEKDGLSYQQANEVLGQGNGWAPGKEEVIHLVISPEKGQLELLGETHEEQIQGFRDVLREAAAEIEEEVEFHQLNWIAGIHLNTDIPHAHMAISRQGTDRITGEPKHIDHLPRTLLPHNEKTPDGEKQFKEGKIAETVNRGIDLTHEAVRLRSQELHEIDSHSRTQPELQLEAGDRTVNTISTLGQDIEKNAPIIDPNQPPGLEPPFDAAEQHDLSQPIELIEMQPTGTDHTAPDTSFGPLHDEPETVFHPNTLDSDKGQKQTQTDSPDRIQRDRETIGRSMVARGEVERLDHEFESMVNHGDKRRFRVFDATHGRTRQISEFDIHRRADAHAGRTVREEAVVDPDKRHLARQIRYENEIHGHDKAIHDHRIIVSKTTKKLGTDLNCATADHAKLQAQVRAIKTHYKSIGCQLPTPLLSRDELGKLQDQAIAGQNVSRIQPLENIRLNLAEEQGKPSRTDKEIARLEGQLLMNRAEQAARHERAHQFERNKHQTRWEIAGEKYSLAELDRRITYKQNRSRIFGTPLVIRTLHLLPSERRASAAEAARLQEIRQAVLEKIEARKDELSSSLDQSVRMTLALTEIHGREQDNQRAREGQRLEKILTRSEISHLIDHASTLGDRAMLQQAYILEAQYQDRQSTDKTPPLDELAARTAGREVLSDIRVSQAREKVHAFIEHKDFVPVVVKDLEGNEVTGRLADFREPRHPIKWLIHRLAESKEQRHLRREVTNAVERERSQLQEEVSNARQCHDVTKTVADNYRERFQTAQEQMPEPIFTTKEIMQLEIYAVRHPDLQERSRIESLINHAELAKHVFTPLALDQTISQNRQQGNPGAEQLRDHEIQPALTTGINQTLSNQTNDAKHQAEPMNAQRNQTGPNQDGPDIDLLH